MATIIILTKPPKNQAAKLGEQIEVTVEGMDDASPAEILRAAADQLEAEE